MLECARGKGDRRAALLIGKGEGHDGGLGGGRVIHREGGVRRRDIAN